MPSAIVFYRIARWLYLHRVPLIPKIMEGLIVVFYGAKISYKCEIGAGSDFAYRGLGVLLHKHSIIGRNCSIGMGSKIVGKGPYKEVARVGDRVYIAPGAVLVGPIIVGNDAVIGANSVVIKSVPDGAIVGGIPAKIIGWVNESDYNIFENRSDVKGIAPFLEDLRG